MEVFNSPNHKNENSDNIIYDSESETESNQSEQNPTIKKNKDIKNWTNEEDKILLDAAKEFEFKNWKKISERLQGRTAIQCSARYKRIRPGIVKGTWSQEEDEKLKIFIKRFGKNWSLISKYIPTRSGKQIRDRYLNTLDPTILREKFTYDEDLRIIEFYKQYGSSWSLIAKNFNGRTGDMIKNRFYSSLKKLVGIENPGNSNDDLNIINPNPENNNKNENNKKNQNLNSIKNSKVGDTVIFNYETNKNLNENEIHSDFNFKEGEINNIERISSLKRTNSNETNKERIIENNNNFGKIAQKIENINDRSKLHFENHKIIEMNIHNKKEIIEENISQDKKLVSFTTQRISPSDFKKKISNHKSKIEDVIIENKDIKMQMKNNFFDENKFNKNSIFKDNLNLFEQKILRKNDHKNNDLYLGKKTKNSKILHDKKEKYHLHSKEENDLNLKNDKITDSDSEFDLEISSLNDDLFKNEAILTNKNLNNNSNCNFINLQEISKGLNLLQRIQSSNNLQNSLNNNRYPMNSPNSNITISSAKDMILNNHNNLLFLNTTSPSNNVINSENNFQNFINMSHNLNSNQNTNSILNLLNLATQNSSNNQISNLNGNVLDYQMNFLIKNLLESNYSRITYCKEELENQQGILKQLLNFTYLKLQHFKNSNENVNQSNSELNPNNDVNKN